MLEELLEKASQPFHNMLAKLKSTFNNRLIQPRRVKERKRRTRPLGAIRSYSLLWFFAGLLTRTKLFLMLCFLHISLEYIRATFKLGLAF